MSDRKIFSKVKEVMDIPQLLEAQLVSYRRFLQDDLPHHQRKEYGLHGVFEALFPIEDNKGYYLLEYEGYSLGVPKYSIRECKARGASYAAPLKVDMSLSVFEREGQKKRTLVEKISNDVYIGEIPLMTDRGTFVINGAERVIVSQLHRAPGIVFNEMTQPTGKVETRARIIPKRGSWVEVLLDSDNLMWVNIDRRKKIPATSFLRALGYESNGDILSLFNETKMLPLDESILGQVLANPIVSEEDGEILAEAGEKIDNDIYDLLCEFDSEEVEVVRDENSMATTILVNTIKKDKSKTESEALSIVYQSVRPGPPPNDETARNFITRLFFDDERYDLGEVGRYRIDHRINVQSEEGCVTLQVEDFIQTMKYLIDIATGDGYLDDIDHLGNRRVRSVGELMETQFAVGVTRMARSAKEQLGVKKKEDLVPADLINARAVATVIQSFFGSSQLSQFLDQTNPVSELTHKRRVSALGPGGLTRERAGFEVRDVHHTHYGRLCPIETPEGPNIGLIASLSCYARINKYGFIETPYQEVKDGKLTGKVVYVDANDEDRYTIAPADVSIDDDGTLSDASVYVRNRGDFMFVDRTEVGFVDVSPMQMVSVSASLIPFLEHDDANRALMGSNMQRQAVPLLTTEAPIVGTGMESKAAKDSGCVIVAKHDGVIEKVEADRVIVKKDSQADEDALLGIYEKDVYDLTKFERSNQDTCINQHVCVSEGEHVQAGDVLADGHATADGELALGKNVLTAYMPWNGYNYEDAIIVSEDLVSHDVYTSIHIVVEEAEARDTKRGPEEFTTEIPNVSDEAIRNLDEMGIVAEGTEVEPGDILVGKITPKGEKELSPEERLLRAIFGEKAGDVRDTSLRVSPGLKGIVINTDLYSRKERDKVSKERDKKRIRDLQREYDEKISDLEEKREDALYSLLKGKTTVEIRERITDNVVVPAGEKWTRKMLKDMSLSDIHPTNGFCVDEEASEKAATVHFKVQRTIHEYDDRIDKEIDKIRRGDELKPGVLKLVKVYVAKKRKLSVGDKMAGRHGNKGVISNVVPREDMPYMPDGTPIQLILNPLGVPSRMNVGQILEVHAALVADQNKERIATPVFNGASSEYVLNSLEELSEKNPHIERDGRVYLRDGRTGEPFDSPVTVGPVYMLKLCHLIEDKAHARSIGPYSLVTQQPLGGKSQFGGQRFGEMEVWALEAYGAAYTLQQVLTVKSDDIIGRSKLYESIVNGDNPPEPGVPESFKVLLREMKALAINVELNEEE
ncbi:DNA-directed RNA polymerase subunit beta [Chitinivibrio alkaliphilus]|uniref:DNA-directed RNA polymerase subunit beta n=1 Tax=Chitinivibrio alkaliphilus ACht1 TaxID=1313304 RepID=U7D506_9BACT|nr:DNA-directed RNA polymerase subunit beta [Chitinivibrio alkaliphilus]ERP31023.1 DNA-directed RNA polymerase, beta subunit [Chitinivibrio alkaliphilus ACht1]